MHIDSRAQAFDALELIGWYGSNELEDHNHWLIALLHNRFPGVRRPDPLRFFVHQYPIYFMYFGAFRLCYPANEALKLSIRMPFAI
jgi:hypothetical protein